MTLRINGSTSGYTEIDAPAVAGSNTITLPSGNGSANQLLKNGATAGSLEFASNVVIDSSGSLLVGISTYSGAGVGFEIEGTGSFGPQIRATAKGSDSYPAFQVFRKSRGASIVQNNDYLFQISCQGFDGTSFISAASIRGEVDGTPGTNDMPGRLVFSTTADGASSPTERMRVASNGSIFFAATSASSITSGAVSGIFINSNGELSSGRALGTASHLLFYNTNGFVGQIFTSGSATSYATASDYRLKENVTPLIGAIDRLQQIPVHRFNFIADPDTVVDGFIAHEAQEVVPECVTGTKDAVDADGNPVMQCIDQSKLVPLLTAALQEALQQIEALTARVTALEAN